MVLIPKSAGFIYQHGVKLCEGRPGEALLLPSLSPRNKFVRLENQQCAKMIKETIDPGSPSSKSQMVGAEPSSQWLPDLGEFFRTFLGLVPYLCTSLFFHMEADWAFGTRSMEFTSSSMRSLRTEIKPKSALPPLTRDRTLAQIFPKCHRNCNTRRGSSHRGRYQHCPCFSTESFQFHLLATEEDLAHWVMGYLESAR